MELPRQLDWWLRDRGTGRLVVVQSPNPALAVFLLAQLCRLLPVNTLDAQLAAIGTGALIAWAADELFRGANPFRRALGAIVLGWQVFALFSR